MIEIIIVYSVLTLIALSAIALGLCMLFKLYL